MTYVWGPFRGGNEQSVADFYLCCDQAGAERVFRHFDDWKQNNIRQPDSLTLQATTNNVCFGSSPTDCGTKVTAISFQSNDGDATDKAIMHVHIESEKMVVIQCVVMQRDSQGRATLIQLVSSPSGPPTRLS